MREQEFHLYIGLPIGIDHRTEVQVFNTVNKRHPKVSYEYMLSGYWAGTEESTLLIKVESTMTDLQETVEAIKEILRDAFIAIDDPNQ